MRERLGIAICLGVLLYTLGAFVWSLTAKPCEVCGRLTVRKARLMRGQRRRRVNVCRRDQQWLKAKGLIKRADALRRH
jgi:hypothetical protein